MAWSDDNRIQEAKRQEYLRRNPDVIKDYELQRAKILLNAVDIMDKAVSVNSDHTNTVAESITNLSLGYAGVSGAALGALFQKLGTRISDMLTMKDLEDYRFFADYSGNKK